MSHDHFVQLAPDKQDLVDHTLGTIQRTAMKIAALPAAYRGEAFDVAHRTYADAMHDYGQDNVAAAKWVEMVMTAVRLLVAEIDHSGGRDGDYT
jgi:hypothetical protein